MININHQERRNNDKNSNTCIGDQIEISGVIYTGRDAVLPKLVKLTQEDPEKIKRQA